MSKAHPSIEQAKADARRLEIPWMAYQAYRHQFFNAARRNIPFLFTIEEWWAWWLKDNRWSNRGRHGDGLVMARRGDKGPYSIENVYCCTARKNREDIPASVRSAGQKCRWDAKTPAERAKWHLAVRGDAHPKSRAVITPKGRYGSCPLAGEAHGITRRAAVYRAQRRTHGWHYEDEGAG